MILRSTWGQNRTDLGEFQASRGYILRPCLNDNKKDMATGILITLALRWGERLENCWGLQASVLAPDSVRPRV